MKSFILKFKNNHTCHFTVKKTLKSLQTQLINWLHTLFPCICYFRMLTLRYFHTKDNVFYFVEYNGQIFPTYVLWYFVSYFLQKWRATVQNGSENFCPQTKAFWIIDLFCTIESVIYYGFREEVDYSFTEVIRYIVQEWRIIFYIKNMHKSILYIMSQFPARYCGIFSQC